MCHFAVGNLSEICQLHKSVGELSDMCQETIRNLSFSKMCQKSVGINPKMYQKSVGIHKCVKIVSNYCTKMCQNSVIFLPSDTFLTHFQQKTWRVSGNIATKKQSKIWQSQYLMHFWHIMKETFPKCFLRNVSEICQTYPSDRFLIHF